MGVPGGNQVSAAMTSCLSGRFSASCVFASPAVVPQGGTFFRDSKVEKVKYFDEGAQGVPEDLLHHVYEEEAKTLADVLIMSACAAVIPVGISLMIFGRPRQSSKNLNFELQSSNFDLWTPRGCQNPLSDLLSLFRLAILDPW